MSTVQQQVNATFIDQGMTMICDTIIELYQAYADSDLSDLSPVDAEKSLKMSFHCWSRSPITWARPGCC